MALLASVGLSWRLLLAASAAAAMDTHGGYTGCAQLLARLQAAAAAAAAAACCKLPAASCLLQSAPLTSTASCPALKMLAPSSQHLVRGSASAAFLQGSNDRTAVPQRPNHAARMQ
jgi:hypothetical protein